MKKAQFDNFNDIFSYLADSLVDTDDFAVETVIDSLYDYGSLHGESLQTKVEQSPFYTKQYKKVTAKQQKQLRAVNSVQEESEYSDDEDDEVEVVPVKAVGRNGKAKNLGGNAYKSSPQTSGTSHYGKTFLGVSAIAKNAKYDLAASSPKYKLGSQRSGTITDPATLNSGNFEATIWVGQRKVSLGAHASVELAAQAHDRALIRANGPHNCVQQGILNFSIHTYARDSLSKFSAFDTILRKQLFGSDWTGPKPCDFGFLMTQALDGPAKRTAPFNAMDGSQRKKRFKGQYSEGDGSNSDEDIDGSVNKGKRLLYGNYYVVEPARIAKRTTAGPEQEEPYFKSTPHKGQPRFKKETVKMGGYNKKPAIAAVLDAAAIPQAGDVIVVMHAPKERNAGRTPYERAIILDKMAFGGWMVVGFPDRTSRHLRGELVTVMGPCEAHMKFMKVPAEAVTEEDKALLSFFERTGSVKLKSGRTAGAAAASAAGVPSPDTHSHIPIPAVSMESPPAAAFASAPAPPPRRDPAVAVHRLTSAWYAHYQLDASLTDTTSQEHEPESLYTMANYPFLHSTSSNSAGGSGADGSWGGETGPGKRGIRGGQFSGVSNRPANFQAFNSNMFSPKMTDISASASYILSQELTFFVRLLEKAQAVVDVALKESPGAAQRMRGNSLEDSTHGTAEANVTARAEATASAMDGTAGVISNGAAANPGTTVLSASSAALPSHSSAASASSTSLSSATSHAPAAVAIPPAPPIPAPLLHPAPLLCWQRSILYPASPDMRDLLTTTRAQLAELLCSRSLDLLSLARRAACVGLGGFEGVHEVLFDAQSCNGSSSASDSAEGSADGNSDGVSEKCVRKYTFDLPADNRKLILDLGVSAALVNASVIISSATSTGEPAAGVIIVGYFHTAFEAALVREQILGLTRTSFGMSTSYGGSAGERNLVSSRPNFTSAEWIELRKMGKLVARFTRKSCMP